MWILYIIAVVWCVEFVVGLVQGFKRGIEITRIAERDRAYRNKMLHRQRHWDGLEPLPGSPYKD